jgi:hypothetical protein
VLDGGVVIAYTLDTGLWLVFASKWVLDYYRMNE